MRIVVHHVIGEIIQFNQSLACEILACD